MVNETEEPVAVVEPVTQRPLTDREREQISELDQSITALAAAIDTGDRHAIAGLCRGVEVEAYALRLMLRGGRP